MEDQVTDIPNEQELQNIMNGTAEIEEQTPADDPNAPFLTWKEGENEILATKEQALKWAQMGRNAPQKIGEVNKSLAKTQAELKALEQYRQIDEWAKKNPDVWNKITQAHQNPQVVQQEEQNQIPEEIQKYLSPLMQQLESMKSFISEVQKEKEQAKLQEEDTALDREIKSIREQNKDLDWDSLDESGLTLEQKVLKHASEIGTTSFRAAFRDMNWESTLQKQGLKAKEELIKERRQKSKIGLLDSPAPNETEVSNYDPRRASDSQILEQALNEFRKLG